MLKSLFIRNFVLIDSLDIKFDKGFSVITGETGAGKSIILGALSLVLGQRADMKIRQTARPDSRDNAFSYSESTLFRMSASGTMAFFASCTVLV